MNMTPPVSVRDGDGSLWVRQQDGTYRMRKGNGHWSDRYQGYSLARIRDEFDGLLSQQFDTDAGECSYRYARV
jgi:hypothetical protein